MRGRAPDPLGGDGRMPGLFERRGGFVVVALPGPERVAAWGPDGLRDGRRPSPRRQGDPPACEGEPWEQRGHGRHRRRCGVGLAWPQAKQHACKGGGVRRAKTRPQGACEGSPCGKARQVWSQARWLCPQRAMVRAPCPATPQGAHSAPQDSAQ